MRIVLVVGARPNFMKVAPILTAFRSRRAAEVRLVHTGQHYGANMSDAFFGDLGLPKPDLNLEVGSGSHAEQTANIMITFEKVCVRERPDWVIVVGDVNSTLACAITAKKLGIRVAHVEAGLRSGDTSMPEEINRLCTDAISDLLFTTDTIANDNLIKEGAVPERIQFVGNTMIDTLLTHIDRARSLPLPKGLDQRRYAVLTLHRPTNVDSKLPLERILESILEIAKHVPVAFPIHPRTHRKLIEFGVFDLLERQTAVYVMQPLSYLPFLGLVAHSSMVLTDSGGIQEETTVLGIPCVTIRPNTERPITCLIGTNVLVDNNPECIRDAALGALKRGHAKAVIPEKWDGHAGERIVHIMLKEKAAVR